MVSQATFPGFNILVVRTSLYDQSILRVDACSDGRRIVSAPPCRTTVKRFCLVMSLAESVEVRTRARVGNDGQDFATPLSGDRQLILPGRSTPGLTFVLSLTPPFYAFHSRGRALLLTCAGLRRSNMPPMLDTELRRHIAAWHCAAMHQGKPALKSDAISLVSFPPVDTNGESVRRQCDSSLIVSATESNGHTRGRGEDAHVLQRAQRGRRNSRQPSGRPVTPPADGSTSPAGSLKITKLRDTISEPWWLRTRGIRGASRHWMRHSVRWYVKSVFSVLR